MITENNQAGILSSRYRPGRYSEQEGSVIKFQKWYLAQSGLEGGMSFPATMRAVLLTGNGGSTFLPQYRLPSAAPVPMI